MDLEVSLSFAKDSWCTRKLIMMIENVLFPSGMSRLSLEGSS
jgi:hypothetical protein